MRRSHAVAALAVAGLAAATLFGIGRRPGPITVDYPLDGSVFPPEFPPPTLEWRDASPRATVWSIDVAFGEGAAASLHATSRGEPLESRPDRPTSRRRDERAAEADARAGGGARLEAGRRDLGGDQEGLDAATGRRHDHRLRRRGPAAGRVARARLDPDLDGSGRRADLLPGRPPDAVQGREGRHQAARPEVRAADRVAAARRRGYREPGAADRHALVRELPLVLARRQDDGHGPRRSAQRQGPVRAVPGAGDLDDPQRERRSPGAPTAASWAASCASPSCRRCRRTRATS